MASTPLGSGPLAGPEHVDSSTLFDCGCPGGIVAPPTGFDLLRKHYLPTVETAVEADNQAFS